MLNVCVPVLKRYDLLSKLLASLEQSTIVPDRVFIINNGRDAIRMKRVLDGTTLRTDVFLPDKSMGVAESWNWFIQNVPEERIIANDDITFAPTSLGKMLMTEGDLVWAEGCGFSCYLIRDSCVTKLGLFDETISPGYGYYEDEDYLQRLDGRGTREPSAISLNVDAGVKHAKSSTLLASSHQEVLEHHRKFKIAQENYSKKWGVVF